MATFAENYRGSDLTFDDNGIYWVNPEDNETWQVMMKWEEPIMQKMADLCVSEGDDVLEIGFGMGILSDMIQAKKPKSHTIIECHKDVIPKLKTWAEGKSNVNIVEGKWFSEVDNLGKYDSILHDTYGDDDRYNFSWFACQVANFNNTKVSWWNCRSQGKDTTLGFDDYQLSYHTVDVDPPSNKYYNEKTYNVPLKILV